MRYHHCEIIYSEGFFMKHQIKILGSILLGNAMLAFGVCAFVVPNDFMLGGSTGIALTLQQWLPLRLSVLSAIINITLFLLGWICMGHKFAAASLLSTLLYPLIMAIFETLPLGTLFHEDRLTCALFFSILSGVGIGIVVRVGGSTGGMDIPPCILQKYRGIPVGDSLLFFDMVILLMQVCTRGFDGILHSILIVSLVSITVNRTIVTGRKKVEIIIISPKYDEIRRAILTDIDCGMTMVNVEGGYSQAPQQAILSVVYAKKYPEIRDAVLRIDPNAFIVASDVTNVNGQGYTLARPNK